MILSFSIELTCHCGSRKPARQQTFFVCSCSAIPSPPNCSAYRSYNRSCGKDSFLRLRSVFGAGADEDDCQTKAKSASRYINACRTLPASSCRGKRSRGGVKIRIRVRQKWEGRGQQWSHRHRNSLDQKHFRRRTPIQTGDGIPLDKPIERVADSIVSGGGTPIYFPKEYGKPRTAR